jgi:hypothetical protein
LLPRRHPAYRRREPGSGASMERVKPRARNGEGQGGPCPAARGRIPSGRNREGESTVAGRCGGGLPRSSEEAR